LTWCTFCSLVFGQRATFEEFNAAAKVDRTPQGTNPDSPRDHRFWRRRKLSPARANNPQPGREPPPTQSYSSLNIILDDRLRAACVSSARATLSVLVSWSRIRLVSAIQATRTAPARKQRIYFVPSQPCSERSIVTPSGPLNLTSTLPRFAISSVPG
jgi:hypothetical protein